MFVLAYFAILIHLLDDVSGENMVQSIANHLIYDQ